MSYNKIQVSVPEKRQFALKSLRSAQIAAGGRDKAISGLNKMSQSLNPYHRMMAYQSLGQTWKGYQEGLIEALAGDTSKDEKKSFYRDASAYLQDKTAHRKQEAEHLENIRVANVYGIINEQAGLQNRAEEYMGGIYDVPMAEGESSGGRGMDFDPKALAGFQSLVEGGQQALDWSQPEHLLGQSFWGSASDSAGSSTSTSGSSIFGTKEGESYSKRPKQHVKPASSIGSLFGTQNALGITDPFALGASLYSGSGALLNRPLESSVAEDYSLAPRTLQVMGMGSFGYGVSASSFGFELGSSLGQIDRQAAFQERGQSGGEEGGGFSYLSGGEGGGGGAAAVSRPYRVRSGETSGGEEGLPSRSSYYGGGMTSGSELSDLSVSKVAQRLARMTGRGTIDPFSLSFDPVPGESVNLKEQIEVMRRQAKAGVGRKKVGTARRQKGGAAISLSDVQARYQESSSSDGGGRFAKERHRFA
jgi:hypothetical protein